MHLFCTILRLMSIFILPTYRIYWVKEGTRLRCPSELGEKNCMEQRKYLRYSYEAEKRESGDWCHEFIKYLQSLWVYLLNRWFVEVGLTRSLLDYLHDLLDGFMWNKRMFSENSVDREFIRGASDMDNKRDQRIPLAISNKLGQKDSLKLLNEGSLRGSIGTKGCSWKSPP